MIGDLPAMASSAYGTNTSTWNLTDVGVPVGQQSLFRHVPPAMAANPMPPQFAGLMQQQPPKPKEKPAMVSRRLVQVFIADPDDNVPLEQSLLYSGQQKLTDATDQELFFEIDIKAVLDIHNEKRVKLINKKVKERVEYLEPVKIRDLKMVVVNVATF